MTDHYATLGVERDASATDIKRAYNRLARELHPDHNASPEAGERFKLVNHAYDVLSNPEKRAAYDRGGDTGMGGFDFGDIFGQFFGGGRTQGPIPRRQPGQDSLLRLSLTLDEVMFGTHKDIRVQTAVLCGTCNGACAAPGTREETCDMCQGSGHVQRQVRSLLGTMVTQQACQHCRGHGTVLPHPCPECDGHGRVRAENVIPVDVPAGVDTGLRIQLPGKGEVGEGGGPAGTLHLEVDVKHHDVFSRDGDDLLGTLEVSLPDAMLGATATVDALDGPATVSLQPGVMAGDVITVSGRGITKLRGSGRGDLRLAVQLMTPGKLDTKSQELVKDLRKRIGAPAPKLAKFQQGLFARLRDRFLR
ncbi:DnaJ C-terminal domain-containing protein [uncultured Agrococcus sp.]|uniref:DnaJ C-terminal domain-containing protein n=1 Tax=uncultured Agrococcus sp. TaxID=382258 RepID=UPI0025F0237D|nr:DnaJ C-terminal domain-containing protein [uncultured Agrococcus sp.]